MDVKKMALDMVSKMIEDQPDVKAAADEVEQKMAVYLPDFSDEQRAKVAGFVTLYVTNLLSEAPGNEDVFVPQVEAILNALVLGFGAANISLMKKSMK
jgi:hypothetical protein